MKKKTNIEKANIINLLISGQTNSFGTQIFDYANQLVISGLSNNTNLYMGLYQGGEAIAGLLFNLVGGVFADKKNRKKLLIYTDILSGIVTLIVYLNYSSKKAWNLIVVNIILAILYSFNSPAYKAIIKDLLSKKNIYKYNSYSKSVSEVINVLSPILGMIIINGFGFKIGMLINSLSFFVSDLIECRLTLIVNDRAIDLKKRDNLIGSFIEGSQYIWNNKKLLIIIISSSLINFFLAGYNFTLPFINKISNSKNLYAYVLVASSVGNILGALLNGISKKSLTPERYSNFLLGMSLATLLVSIFKFSNILILLLISLAMLCLTFFNIQMISGIQSEIPDEFMGRVFGAVFTISTLFAPIGTYTFSILNILDWSAFIIIGFGEFIVFVLMKFGLIFFNSHHLD